MSFNPNNFNNDKLTVIPSTTPGEHTILDILNAASTDPRVRWATGDLVFQSVDVASTINLKADTINLLDSANLSVINYAHPWWGDTIPTLLYDSTQPTNGAMSITTTDLATGFETGSILLKVGDSTGPAGHPGQIYIVGGSVTNPANTNMAYPVELLGGDHASSGNGGGVNLTGGNSATGQGGSVTLLTGNGATRGKFRIADGTEGTVGHVWTQSLADGTGSWSVAAGAGANTALSNLAATSVNQNLLPDIDLSKSLGSSIKQWNELYVGNLTVRYINQQFWGSPTPSVNIDQDLVADPSKAAFFGTTDLATDTDPMEVYFHGGANTFSGSTKNTGLTNLSSGDIEDGSGNTGEIQVHSGNIYSGTGQTGQVGLTSGAANQGDTGPAVINTGSSQLGNTGNTEIRTGNTAAGTGNTGNISLIVGTSFGGTRGYIQFKDGSEGTPGYVWTSSGSDGEGTWMASSAGANQSLSNLLTTNINAPLVFAGAYGINTNNQLLSANSDAIYVNTGSVVDGTSGATQLTSGNATGTGDTGEVYLYSGNSTNGSTGQAGFGTGNASVLSGDVWITTGDAADTGSINLLTGTASGTRGKIVFMDGSEGTAGQIWTSTDVNGSGAWAPAPAGGANTSLSNLTNPTSINQNLLPDATANNRKIGIPAQMWSEVHTSNLLNENGGLGIYSLSQMILESSDQITINPTENLFLYPSAGKRVVVGSNGDTNPDNHPLFFQKDYVDINYWGDEVVAIVAPSTVPNNSSAFHIATGDLNVDSTTHDMSLVTGHNEFVNTTAGKRTGDLYLQTGVIVDGTGAGNSGAIFLVSGYNQGTGSTGLVRLSSGEGNGSGNTGSITTESGPAGGNSGNAILRSGNAGGDSGNVLISSGSATGTRGEIRLQANDIKFTDNLSIRITETAVNWWTTSSPGLEFSSPLNPNDYVVSTSNAATDVGTASLAVVTGSNEIASSTAGTGAAYMATGQISDAGASGNTGEIVIYSGDNSGSGNSGNITLEVGLAGGTRGEVQIKSGEYNILSYADAFWGSPGPAFLLNLDAVADHMTFGTRDALVASQPQQNVVIGTGRNRGVGGASVPTGEIYVTTGEADGTITTGNMAIFTGPKVTGSTTGGSGSIDLSSGTVQAGNGDTGYVNVYSGVNSGTGSSGNVDVHTGNSSAANSGNLSLFTGTAVGTRGDIKLSGRQIQLDSDAMAYYQSDYTDGYWVAQQPAIVVDSSVPNGNGNFIIGSTDISTTNTETHWIQVMTGYNNGATVAGQRTGALILGTGYVTAGAGNSGTIEIFTGDVVDGNSQRVLVTSGVSSGTGNSGNLQFLTGTAVSGTTGNIQIQTGATGGARGSIELNASSVEVNSAVMNMNNNPIRELPLAIPTLTTDAVSVDYVYQRVGHWKRYRVNYTYFTAAALTETKNLFTLAAGESIDEVVVKHAAAVSGPSISNAFIEVGKTGTVDAYATSTGVFSAASGTGFTRFGTDIIESFDSTTQVTVTLTTVGANVNVATAGAIDVWVKIVNIALNLAATATLS